MRRSNWHIYLVSAAFLASACGASKAEKKQISTPTPPPNVNSAASPAATPANGNANSVVVTPNASQASNAMDPRNLDKTVERRSPRDRRNRVESDPSATPVPPTYKDAPEDSAFAVYMDQTGAVIETRVFKKHPQLQKVEIKWTDPRSKAAKVSLRNGKVIEIKAVRISNLQTIPTSELLKVLGIREPASKTGRSRVSP